MLPNEVLAFSSSLDDLYRKMLTEDYEGALPVFVSNRTAPEFEAPKVVKDEKSTSFLVSQPDKVIESPKMTKELFDALEYSRSESNKTWQNVVVAVQKGNPSPFDVAEIKKRVEQKNTEAVELLAWMCANGIGVKQDLQKSWELYSFASRLGVETAGQNANAVWRAMNNYQKQTMSPF